MVSAGGEECRESQKDVNVIFFHSGSVLFLREDISDSDLQGSGGVVAGLLIVVGAGEVVVDQTIVADPFEGEEEVDGGGVGDANASYETGIETAVAAYQTAFSRLKNVTSRRRRAL